MVRLAVSCSPQPQPHFIRGPCGRPRLTFEFLLRWSPYSEVAAPSGIWRSARIWRQSAKCARIRLAVSCSPQPQPHFHPRPSVDGQKLPEGGEIYGNA